ncbi:hypothetical protein NE237_000881 [Protea cynaroides]|uniref:Uncharacterized protein n=1 Tax=Protea cynaroides TaxID=273540 RepID=A0A9Q0QXJ6_9MAGN|nr:hypothetical protein NE237_000881 [Protea cynaroides]
MGCPCCSTTAPIPVPNASVSTVKGCEKIREGAPRLQREKPELKSPPALRTDDLAQTGASLGLQCCLWSCYCCHECRLQAKNLILNHGSRRRGLGSKIAAEI